MGIQGDWKWCHKCQALFYGGLASRCPGGGAHDPQWSQNTYFPYLHVRGDNLQKDWRWCSKCQGLFWTGGQAQASACPMGGAHDGPTDAPYAVLFDVKEKPAYGAVYQHGWRWCSQCHGLFYGDGDGGLCPSGGKHRDPSGRDHVLLCQPSKGGFSMTAFEQAARIDVNHAAIVSPARGEVQGDWKWCHKCQAIFYGKMPSHCPGGGAHDPQWSSEYLPYVNMKGRNVQSDWRWCHKCQGLFLSDGYKQGGVCTQGGAHDCTGSGRYGLLFDVDEKIDCRSVYQHGWRWCAQCQSLYFGGSDGGLCPAGGGRHRDGSGRDYVMLWKSQKGYSQEALDRATALDVNYSRVVNPSAGTVHGEWRWCHKCQGMFYGRNPSRCPDGGAHDPQGSAEYFPYLNVKGDNLTDGWRGCNKCQGLFFGEKSLQAGVCPTGGAHDCAGSHVYGILAQVSEQPAYQSVYQHHWRKCRQCRGLFFGDDGGGLCPAGGKHLDSGTDYVMLMGGSSPGAFARAAALDLHHDKVGVGRVWSPRSARSPYVEAHCQLIVDYDLNRDLTPDNRFEVVLIPRRADDSVIAGARISLFADSQLIIVQEEDGTTTKHLVNAATPVVLTASASGRCRFTIEPQSAELTLPVFKAQSDAMEPGRWSVFCPDSDLHAKLASVTGSQLLATPPGKAAPLLPAPGGSRTNPTADAEALAGAVSLLMRACVNYELAVTTSPADLSFAVGGNEPETRVLTPAPMLEIDPQASVRRILCRLAESSASARSPVGQPVASPAAGEGAPADDSPQSFGTWDWATGVVNTVVGGSTGVVNTVVGGSTGVVNTVADGATGVANKIANTATEVSSSIVSNAKGAVGTAGQYLDTSGAAAQVLIQHANLAVLRPVEQFAASTIASATQLAIDTSDGIMVIALVVENGVSNLVKTVVDAVESAALVTAAFFKRVGVQIMDVIEFLAALFDWDDILTTQDHIKRILDAQMAAVGGTIQEQRGKLGDYVQHLRSYLASVRPAHRRPTTTLPFSLDDLPSMGGHFGFLADKLVAHLPRLGLPPGLNDLIPRLPTISGAVATELRTFSKLLESSLLTTAIQDPRNFVKLGLDDLLAFVVPLAEGGLSVLAAVADALLACVPPMMTLVERVLNFHIDIPVVTELIERLVFRGRQQLTLGSLLTLLAAAFLNVLYKTILGTTRGPFAEDGSLSFATDGAKTTDIALLAVAATASFFQVLFTAVYLKYPETKRFMAIFSSFAGVIGPLAGIPYSLPKESFFFGEQWTNWTLNMAASFAQFIDSLRVFRYIEYTWDVVGEEEPGQGLGIFSALAGLGMLICTLEGSIRYLAGSRPGDGGRAMLDQWAQAAAAVNNLVPILKAPGNDDAAKAATDRLQALVSLVANGVAKGLGVGALVDNIVHPEATLG